MTEKLARFWLSLGDLPSSVPAKILANYQTALAFYEAREQAGPVLGAAWKRLLPWQDLQLLRKKLEHLQSLGIVFLTPEDENWPWMLNHLEDPPIGLYCLGDTQLLRDPKLFAMVGTRHCTVYGQRMARAIARDTPVLRCIAAAYFSSSVAARAPSPTAVTTWRRGFTHISPAA